MRLVLLGGAPGVGTSAVARAVLTHHQGPPGSAPLLQWVDVDAAPPATGVHWVQLVASEEAWRARFETDGERPRIDTFYEQRYRDAQTEAGLADTVVDTSHLQVREVAHRVHTLMTGSS